MTFQRKENGLLGWFNSLSQLEVIKTEVFKGIGSKFYLRVKEPGTFKVTEILKIAEIIKVDPTVVFNKIKLSAHGK